MSIYVPKNLSCVYISIVLQRANQLIGDFNTNLSETFKSNKNKKPNKQKIIDLNNVINKLKPIEG